MNSWIRALTSTVGRKYLMGVTGVLLFLFVLGHLSGNLTLWSGREAMNAYAAMLHGLGPGLWVARIGLLVIFTVHVVCAISLAGRNSAARPVAYKGGEGIDSTVASRTMALTGMTVLAFVIFHLAHFTLGVVSPETAKGGENIDALGRPDVWGMVVSDFSSAPIALAYVVFMVVLGFHLVHGLASAFQSLGWVRPRYRGFVKMAAGGITAAAVLGNVLLPLSVLTGVVKDEGDIAKVNAPAAVSSVKEDQ